LTCEGVEIAVEVSTLTQHVLIREGRLVPRQSQDEAALRLAEELDIRFANRFLADRAVTLIIFTPMENRRPFRQKLERELEKVLLLHEKPLEPIEIEGALIHVHEAMPERRRVSAGVVNRRSSPDILKNAKAALEDRLMSKRAWSRVRKSNDSWLALLNAYGILANADTYRQALTSSTVDHSFDKIFIVSTSARVEVLYQRPR
jgi:hypothetical protein